MPNSLEILAVTDPFNWAGLAAFLTAVAGVMAAYAAVVRAKKETRREADDECAKKLLEAREDAMRASDELYEIRKRRVQ